MKALTIMQPYASAIIAGHKRFETCKWKPGKTKNFILHAGRKEVNAIDNRFIQQRVDNWPMGYQLPTGKALGIVRIIKCFDALDVYHDQLNPNPSPATELELQLGNYNGLHFAWELEVVEVFDKPIDTIGQQRFWNWYDKKD